MTTTRKNLLSWTMLSAGLLCGAPGRSDSPEAAWMYEVTTEVDMPHLEDNLRYAITRERRCLSVLQLHRLFPVIDHPALSGCRLGPETRDGDSTKSELSCHPDHGTRGSAVWHTRRGDEVGILSVRLGGKNMTFNQRVTAHLLGSCDVAH